MNKRFNPNLMKTALAELGKSSFVPMPGGQVPPDPNAQAAAGGAMPPGGDPAAMGMPPGDPSQQMDPAMMAQLQGGDPSGMAPGAPAPDPNAAAMDPSGGGQPPMDPGTGQGPDIKRQIHEALVENGVVKTPKLKPEDMFQHIQSILESLCGALGIQCPPAPIPSNKPKGEGESKPASGGSDSGSKPEQKSAALKAALTKIRGN